jgi:uridine kinase
LKTDSVIIAIDGRCAAGKTTLAAEFSAKLKASIIHMDDFFLPKNLRTPERLEQPGGNIHYERFAEEVLPFLRGSEPFSHRVFDCSIGDYNGTKKILPTRFRIIEGSYSHHPIFGEYMDLRIFLDIPPDIQMRRIEKRNGKEAAKNFKKWIALEEKYFMFYFHTD